MQSGGPKGRYVARSCHLLRCACPTWRVSLVVKIERSVPEKWQECVECGAAASGWACRLPPFHLAVLRATWLCFHTPHRTDVQISRIRLSDKTSRLRSRRRAPFTRRFRQFGYAPSTRPKKTIADATPVKTHTGSKPLPNGRSRLNPSANIATETRPLNITGQFIGTSQLYWRPASIALRRQPRSFPLTPVRFYPQPIL